MEMCSHSKLADFAKLIYEDMSKEKLEMDTICYNAFVAAVLQDGQEHLSNGPSFKTFRPYRCLPDHTDPPSEDHRNPAQVELRVCTEDGVQLDCEDEALALAVWGVDSSPYDDCLCLPSLYIEVTERRAQDGEKTRRRYAFVSPFTLVAELEALLAHWGDSLVTVVSPVSETRSLIETEQLRLRQEHPTVRLTPTLTKIASEQSRSRSCLHVSPPASQPACMPVLLLACIAACVLLSVLRCVALQAFWSCVWYFHNVGLPSAFLLLERVCCPPAGRDQSEDGATETGVAAVSTASRLASVLDERSVPPAELLAACVAAVKATSGCLSRGEGTAAEVAPAAGGL
jgi:hypothetical protein